jgi:DNA (cytosine-5)-methyltransferase 1
MSAYYNEIDPYAAQWLRNLISAGHIAPGDVDERSILEVKADDIKGYAQCHFFAGIGGWSYALRLAGWSDDRPVWTGSCPCQPFSAAGKQRGSDDERHLWPAFFRIISECRPATVIGEQVAGGAGLAWWDHVAADLEGDSYAAAAAVVGAHSVGAPHIRQRLYWVAHSDSQQRGAAQGQPHAGADGRDDVGRGGEDCIMGYSDNEGLEGRCDDAGEHASEFVAGAASPWNDLEWLQCSDGKARPTQPGLFPLAHGVSGRVGRLRAYGNAIVPQVAAAFITAALDAVSEDRA